MLVQMQIWGGGIAPTHSQPVTWRGWVVCTMPFLFYPQKRPGTHCTGGWVGLGACLDGTENLAPIRICSPELPVCSNSLNWLLLYPNHWSMMMQLKCNGTYHDITQSLFPSLSCNARNHYTSTEHPTNASKRREVTSLLANMPRFSCLRSTGMPNVTQSSCVSYRADVYIQLYI